MDFPHCFAPGREIRLGSQANLCTNLCLFKGLVLVPRGHLVHSRELDAMVSQGALELVLVDGVSSKHKIIENVACMLPVEGNRSIQFKGSSTQSWNMQQNAFPAQRKSFQITYNWHLFQTLCFLQFLPFSRHPPLPFPSSSSAMRFDTYYHVQTR